MIGVGFAMHTYGFRKDPYATQQKISALYALNGGAYQIKYFGEFNEVLGKYDVVVNAEYYNPVLNNFFGLGNETVKDPTKSLDYYKVRYKYSEVNAQLRNRFNPILSVALGPTVAHYWNRYNDNEGKILGKPSLIGLDSADIYSNKTYAGATLSILVNNLDNVLLPTRGINWNTEFTALGGLTQTSRPFTKLTSDMAVHAALSDPAKVVAVLRLGGGHIFSQHYEYFQALNLGENNFLRGFRKNRFSGNSLAYGSLEMRVKLFDSKSHVLPGSVGVIGFDDIGRVWVKNEDSKKWHNAYGAGFYFTPYEYVLISATVAFSKEENLFNFSVGTKFNITF
jgi:outer membrane protein assembly factor BamA